MSSTVHRGRAVRKFGKCERKLKVLSCQAAIRQQCGCNELRVCVCILGCVRVIEWSFLFLFPFSPVLFYSHIHMSSHTVILMRGGQDSLQNSRFIKPEYSGGSVLEH